jgi:hypothetical protein
MTSYQAFSLGLLLALPLAPAAAACAPSAPSTSSAGGSGVGGSEGGGGAVDAPLTLESADPALVDPLGGSRVLVRGAGLTGTTRVTLGGDERPFVVLGDDELSLTSGPLTGPEAELVVTRGALEARLTLEVWSPAELPGARLFDAASGVVGDEDTTLYEWQRVAELPAEWRVRDGNTTTYHPATGRFWMVGGWNGNQEPGGFSSVPPDSVYPPENTTDEVWSSPDGLSWTLELAHGHGQFERRHAHNTVVFQDRLWVIGGDAHQGYDNHDVLSSADGLEWVEELPPGAPPWAPRSLQITGVYGGRIWTGGGQDLLGDPAGYVHHNDLWSSEDGQTWTLVAPDGPASETRWAGCGAVDGFVEFQGRMWLVGCARYDEVGGHQMRAEVWSTTDGVTWQRHADPPWAGKIWHNALVWDGRLWILFGYTSGDPANGWPQDNSKEAWWSADGETWHAATMPDDPVPGSHAQGVAVTDEHLVYAGGNHTFGIGLGEVRSVWRLVPQRGQAVSAWTERGSLGLTVTAEGVARPVRVPDAFGSGSPGLELDGSRMAMALAEPDEQLAGRTVLWVARAPYQPAPYGWEETYAPHASVLGGVDALGYPNSSIGLSSGGALAMVNREEGTGPVGEPLWTHLEAGSGLQEGPGEVRLLGLSHAVDGAVTAFIDGAPEPAGSAGYGSPRRWSRLGGSQDDGYYGPNTRFGGTLGAVLVLPEVVDQDTVNRIHAWARGRFGAR